MFQVVDEHQNAVGMTAEAPPCRKRDLLFGAAGDLVTATAYHPELSLLGPGRKLTNAAFNRETANARLLEPGEQLRKVLFLRLTGNQEMDVQEVMATRGAHEAFLPTAWAPTSSAI